MPAVDHHARQAMYRARSVPQTGWERFLAFFHIYGPGVYVEKGFFIEWPAGGSRWFEWSFGYIRDNCLRYLRLRASKPYWRYSKDQADENGIRHLATLTLDLNQASHAGDLKTRAGPVEFDDGLVPDLREASNRPRDLYLK